MIPSCTLLNGVCFLISIQCFLIVMEFVVGGGIVSFYRADLGLLVLTGVGTTVVHQYIFLIAVHNHYEVELTANTH